jgi:hypothetical protein
MTRLTLAALASLFFASLPVSHASAMSISCTVTPTPDGFVALRDRPNAASRLLHRIRPGDHVEYMKRDDETFVPGNWQLVHVLPGERQETAPMFREVNGQPAADRLTEAQRRRVKSGWMHRRYLDNCG